MLTLRLQHVPTLNPHSKLPETAEELQDPPGSIFTVFCVGVLPCPAGGLVHTDARRKSRERFFLKKASLCTCLASQTAWFEKLPRHNVQFLFFEREMVFMVLF